MLATRRAYGLLAGVLVAGLALGGCQSTVAGRATAAPMAASPDPAGGSPLPAATGSPPGSPGHAPRATRGPCHYAETTTTLADPANQDAGLPPDPDPTPASGTQPVTLSTNRGIIVIALDRARAPCAVQSFLYLVGQRFYDGTPCHRVSNTQPDGLGVLQCGAPGGHANGGPTYQYAEENLASADYSTRVVAMANGGKGTTGSQFFIMHEDAPELTKSYSVIGRVAAGFDVVTAVAAAGSDHTNQAGGGAPKRPITIVTARG
ncbi:MAG TPA: peptidylprolyl isomerase [Mycobacteriales bacterium]|nr:peptidylprolyl isomerase [Mycobacteriales bacterium]